jgi:tetratricopeptide (TPR) repeat protein
MAKSVFGVDDSEQLGGAYHTQRILNPHVIVVTKTRSRSLIPVVGLAVFVLGGVSALGIWQVLRSTPMVSEVKALARAGQYARAQALLAHYLQRHPDDDQAHLLMAQLATEPTQAQPVLALESLRAIRPTSPKQSAVLKFVEGKAHYQEARYDLAEACWREAQQLDSTVPEAGWALLDLLDKEGRKDEAHALGMQLHEIEPDPRDQVRILLEVARLDLESPMPQSQVHLFEPLVKQHLANLPLSLSVGIALIRLNRREEGLKILQDALNDHPDSPDVWDAWMSGVNWLAEPDKLAEELARLPKALAALPRFAEYDGLVAQNARDWRSAARAYRQALAYQPSNAGVYPRLTFVLRQAGENAEADRVDQAHKALKDAFKQMRGANFETSDMTESPYVPGQDFAQTRGAYMEAALIRSLGLTPHVELYQQIAEFREKMGRPDEARAWHRLVLRDSPENALSLAALKRLK